MKRGDIYALMRRGPLGPLDYSVAFPQANTVSTVWSIVGLVSAGVDSVTEMHLALSSDPESRMSDRQVRYYADAARYLGLLDKQGTNYTLTEIGKDFCNSDQRDKKTIFISQLSGMRSVFDLTMDFLLRDNFPDETTLQYAMKLDDSMGKNDSDGDTIARRAQCLEAWLQWLDAQVG